MEQYNEIEWDDYNIFKNEIDHGVKYWEIEQCFENPYILLRRKKKKRRKKKGENKKVLLGRTDGGRYLFIVFEDKGNGIARPISARDMEKPERRLYEEKVRIF